MSHQDRSHPRLDSFGDALPSRALSRCGTHRFWHPLEKNGYIGELESVCFSPDSRTVVAASGSTARVWNLEDGREVTVLSGHEDLVNAVRYVSNARIATASADRTVRLWDAESGTELRRWSLKGLEARCLAVSPDGRTLLVGTSAPNFAVIDLGTGEFVRWVGAVMAVEVIAFSPDGTQVVTFERTSELTYLCAFDTSTWSLQWSAEGFVEGDPSWLSFSRDGQHVICPAHAEGFSLLRRTYDARTGVLLAEAWESKQPVFLSDGTVAQVSFRQLQILRDGQEERKVDIPTVDLCSNWELVISPDERWATFARAPSPLLLIELSTGKVRPTHAHRGGVWQLTFSRDGTHLLTASHDGTMRTWEHASGRQVASVALLEHVEEYWLLLTEGRVLQLRQWGRTLSRDLLAGTEAELKDDCWPDHVVWSADGVLFAHVSTHGSERSIHLHDTRTGKLRGSPSLENGDPCALSRTGRLLVTHEPPREHGGARAGLRVWDLERGTPYLENALSSGWGQPVFSPDDAWLALREGIHTIVLVDLTRPEHPIRVESPTDISAFAFSEDRRLLASGNKEGQVRVWNTRGELLGVMEGHRAPVTALAFSADGALLASGSTDTTVLVWPSSAWAPEER